MYQVQAISKHTETGRFALGAFPDRVDAVDYATSFDGEVEVVDERLGRLIGTSKDGLWTECTDVVRRASV